MRCTPVASSTIAAASSSTAADQIVAAPAALPPASLPFGAPQFLFADDRRHHTPPPPPPYEQLATRTDHKPGEVLGVGGENPSDPRVTLLGGGPAPEGPDLSAVRNLRARSARAE